MAKNDQQCLGATTIFGRVNVSTCQRPCHVSTAQPARSSPCGDTSTKPPARGPLFVTNTGALHYGKTLKVLRVLIGNGWSLYGLHSFRVGGAQALALTDRSVVYIMARGRWKSSESVSRYVAAPDDVLCDDAAAMSVTAVQRRTNRNRQYLPVSRPTSLSPKSLV